NSMGSELWEPQGEVVWMVAYGSTYWRGLGLAPDGGGGAFLSLSASPGPSTPATLRLQKLDFLGQTVWNPQGVTVESAPWPDPGDLLAGSDGGCTIAWSRNVVGGARAMLQRFDESGTASWGTAVSLASTPGNQIATRLEGDGAGGAVCCWLDE